MSGDDEIVKGYVLFPCYLGTPCGRARMTAADLDAMIRAIVDELQREAHAGAAKLAHGPVAARAHGQAALDYGLLRNIWT